MNQNEETLERFLAEIAEKLPADNVVEVHLFQPMRQAGIESGVAVVAVNEQQPTRAEGAAENESAAASSFAAAAENSLYGASESRLAIYTAKYILALKGADRGKWDFSIQPDADAPLVTVDQVVRGVQRRAGDAQDAERLTGDEFRAAVKPGSRTI